jgi:hypothetical protein
MAEHDIGDPHEVDHAKKQKEIFASFRREMLHI